MNNNREIEIPSFMNTKYPKRNSSNLERTNYYKHEKQLREDYINAKAQSRNSDKIKAKRTIEKISPSAMLKRYALIFGLGALTATTVLEFDNIINLKEKFEQMNTEAEYLSPYYDIILENSTLTDDKENYYYDATNIGTTFKEMIESGTSEEVIAYVSATALSKDFEKDELNTVFHYALEQSPEDWALSNGYTDINDKSLEKDVKSIIARHVNIAEYEQSLESMLSDSKNDTNENEKGIGGK